MSVLYALSFVLMMCGLTQGIAGIVDMLSGVPVTDSIFFISGSFVISIGVLLYFFTQNKRQDFKIKQMFVATTLSWILFALFSSFPFYFAAPHLSFTDAFFESMSGLTTTGSSIIPNVESLSNGTLFFRSLLQWIGGAGIIVVVLLVLPVLSMGGMHFFTTESSEQTNKLQPKISKSMADIFTAFVILTGLCCACLFGAGMSFFDAINHAMTCIATGGFSTHNNSIAYFNSPTIEWILTFFMFLAGFPLLMWGLLKRGQWHIVADNRQIFLYIKCVIGIILFTTLWRFILTGLPFADTFRTTAFHVVSVMTSTGFVTQNYVLWGSFAVALFIFLMLTGGCTGSTTGGVKMLRYSVIFSMIKARFMGLLQPFGVFVPRYGTQAVSDKIISGVFVFISLFLGILGLGTFCLTCLGLDFLTALSAALTAVSNVGPAMGSLSPTGTFEGLTDAAKWILSFLMLLGRLEIASVLILITPFFWKKNL